jgi:hypothetical protein
MTYFDCFVVGSWMFVIGWFAGAIYMQNQDEKTENPPLTVSGRPELRSESEEWRFPVEAIVSAD